MISRFDWKLITASAFVLVLLGFAISVYGLVIDNNAVVVSGLAVIGTICVSWGAWVISMIRLALTGIERTARRIHEVRQDIKEIKSLIGHEIMSHGKR